MWSTQLHKIISTNPTSFASQTKISIMEVALNFQKVVVRDCRCYEGKQIYD